MAIRRNGKVEFRCPIGGELYSSLHDMTTHFESVLRELRSSPTHYINGHFVLAEEAEDFALDMFVRSATVHSEDAWDMLLDILSADVFGGSLYDDDEWIDVGAYGFVGEDGSDTSEDDDDDETTDDDSSSEDAGSDQDEGEDNYITITIT